MFLRKLFSKNNRAKWVLIDLIVVIIGVYTAFLIQSYAEDKKNDKEKNKVLSSLKYEMEYFRYRMYQTSLGMQTQTKELKEVQAKGTYRIFTDFRFIQPQYDYQAIEYALRLQNTEIVDFELYDALQSLFVEIRKVEHVERLLTETGRRFRSIPSNLDKSSENYKILWTENWDNFNRFVTLINDRGQIAGRIAKASVESMPIINERLGLKRVREIEEDILRENLGLLGNENEAIKVGKQFFPNFSDKELSDLYQKSRSQGIESD